MKTLEKLNELQSQLDAIKEELQNAQKQMPSIINGEVEYVDDWMNRYVWIRYDGKRIILSKREVEEILKFWPNESK
jgi:hypothetical protein